MEYTKGKWEVQLNQGATLGAEKPKYLVGTGSIWVALTTSEADAHLIAAAVNACKAINPDNPQAVAESIGDWYKALEAIASCESVVEGDIVDIAQKALAKGK